MTQPAKSEIECKISLIATLEKFDLLSTTVQQTMPGHDTQADVMIVKQCEQDRRYAKMAIERAAKHIHRLEAIVRVFEHGLHDAQAADTLLKVSGSDMEKEAAKMSMKARQKILDRILFVRQRQGT